MAQLGAVRLAVGIGDEALDHRAVGATGGVQAKLERLDGSGRGGGVIGAEQRGWQHGNLQNGLYVHSLERAP